MHFFMGDQTSIIYINTYLILLLFIVLQEADKREAEEQIRIQNILQGNPLLSYGGGSAAPKVSQKVKRRWNDDVVFKNCARTEPEKNTTFINDCIRSDFHRKFMDKYIK